MLLALDTATSTASVAIYNLNDQSLLAEQTWEARRRQTQDLLVITHQLLAQLELTPQALTALAVTTGPGSFTGVRIGISTVKGIGLGLPTAPVVVGIPTLCVTAAPWLELLARCQPTSLLCAFTHAGRGRYNWAWFGPKNLLWRPAAADHASGDLAQLCLALQERQPTPIWLAGEPDAALPEALTGLHHVQLIDAVSSWRRAGQLARLAASQLAQGVHDQLENLQPLYLRNP
ncbi:MAG: tRNA (adenosine(37)-N6)-threonylcarbamoyltransferase complex dimerization subunit type 1 TsaB [Caldilineaceae bacterium]